jgi:hypothetical protein
MGHRQPLPAHRYPEVRAICERYDLPYNTGGFGAQFDSVVAKICRLALPWTDSGEDDPEEAPFAVIAASGATERRPVAA